MSSLENIENLKSDIKSVLDQINIDDLKAELSDLTKQTMAEDFWQDNIKAQKISQKRSILEQEVNEWTKLLSDINELVEFAKLDDDSLSNEIEDKYQLLLSKFNKLKNILKFNGKFDKSEAIITIQSGAGGLDAQDWAAMLLKMYIKWTEKNDDYKASLINESKDDEAGIKQATIQISGPYAYGKLKGEHGVHRLVRLSPFNSANSRETSFAMVEVIPEIDEPEKIEIDEKDLKIDVFRAGGHGGQSVNTTDSAVRITHIPTNITVSIQNERSQIQNKDKALAILKSKLIQLQEEQHKEKISQLKGPNQEAAWGNQIRNYVLNPYTMVKDSRSKFESSDVNAVLEGDIDDLLDAYLEHNL